jgi:hypothetical protein
MTGLCLIGCAGNPQAASPSNDQTKNQTVKVYFQGEGPGREVRRFQKFLEIALDDHGMVRVDSAAKADAVVKLQFNDKEEIAFLHAPVLWMTLSARNGEQYILKSCNTVSTSADVYAEPVKYVDIIKLPAKWERAYPRFAVYIDESSFKGSEEVVKRFKDRLAEQSYRFVKTNSEADAELKSIKVQKLAIPMNTISHSRHYEISYRDSDHVFSSGNGSDITYVGVEKSVKTENLPCWSTAETFGNNNDRFWADADMIAKRIQEQISKKAAHSN